MRGFDNNFAGVPLDEVRELYVKACGKRAEKRKVALTKTVNNSKNLVDSLQKDLGNALRDYRQAAAELEGFEGHENALHEKLRAEFDALLKLPKVTSVDWRGDCLTVGISNIQVTDPRSKKVHDIGEFKLVVDTRQTQLLFWNTTRRVTAYEEGMNAPHVFPDGRPCLGTMNEVIPKLVANYEWSALIQMGITFLESVNVRDAAGRRVDSWPLAEVEVVKAPKKKKKAARRRAEAVAEVADVAQEEAQETEAPAEAAEGH